MNPNAFWFGSVLICLDLPWFFRIFIWKHGLTQFLDCFVLQSRKTADSPAAMCWGENEDYFECIHGFKEKKHKLAVATEKKRREGLGTTFDIHSNSATDDYFSKGITAAKFKKKVNTEE